MAATCGDSGEKKKKISHEDFVSEEELILHNSGVVYALEQEYVEKRSSSGE